MSQQVAPQESNQPASESGESKDVHSYFYIPLMIVGGLIGAACCVGLYFAIGNALPWLRKIPIIILIFPALVIIGLLSAADTAIAKRSPSLMRAPTIPSTAPGSPSRASPLRSSSVRATTTL